MDARERLEPPADKPLLMILVKRTTIFLFAICALSLFYWIVGSETSFLDTTQSMLLSILRLSSLGLIVASFFGILIAVAMALFRMFSLRVVGLLGYAVAIAIGAGTLVVAQSVSILSKGLP